MLTQESHGAELLFEMSEAEKGQKSIRARVTTQAHTKTHSKSRQRENRWGVVGGDK